ncbi:lipid-A-disaccharide synthase [Roseobacter denitrificans]|uniref:Lipid-A-disaccharide synthase n=1 Tax=Roseobacter denitrificans (strain ATCC 33942 / OCh 114) TaxID=375451 RepID=Q166E4_ROSDO|nr:lipid-A-disaccharide synthase [Roseobacter denitrificans]ABG32149.1 lipid-A-disaccharide synthase [Roseobacter denitrificans OCh 114]
MKRAFIIAGEPSGDKLGGALMVGLKTLSPGIAFDGVGGPLMQAQGLESRFPMDELSVMGITEVLPKYRALKARIRETAQAVIASNPDVLITIDSPDFCFRVAKLVKKSSSIRTVHYVAPTVWAWRPGRAAKISKFVDHLLALFPFEPAYFTPHGMACDFVGHPVVAEPVATQDEAEAFRAEHDIGSAPLLMVLPGSRRGEVARLADVFGGAISPVLARHPGLKVVVPAARPVAQQVKEAVAQWPVAPVVIDPRDMASEDAACAKSAAFRAADIALAASGTVSLELAASRTPMVVAYRMHWLSYRLIRAMALVDTVTLVNLVSDTRFVPEFLGPDCESSAIGQALIDVLKTPSDQVEAMQITMERLGHRGEAPGLRAARAILHRAGV